MRYAGDSPVQLVVNEEEWKQWRIAHSDLAPFAEHWVALMEAEIHQRSKQVRHVAKLTMEETRATVANLTDAQVREVILALRKAWYLGPSLRNWALQRDILRPTD